MINALVLSLFLTAQCAVLTEAPPPKSYVYRVMVSMNQTVNTILGGEPDETLSSRWGRARARGSKPAKAACWVLDKIDPCHCTVAIEFTPEGEPLPHQLHTKDR